MSRLMPTFQRRRLPKVPTVSSPAAAHTEHAVGRRSLRCRSAWTFVGGAVLPGGLFLSEDAGQTWALVRLLWDRPERVNWFGGGYDWPGIHSIAVDKRNRPHVAWAWCSMRRRVAGHRRRRHDVGGPCERHEGLVHATGTPR